MNSLNTNTVEAHAFLPDTPPSVARRFGAVVEPYLADAHALAHWLTSNRADSQDVVQDACLRALRGIGNFADGDARSWVLTIVRRTAYDWLDRNRPAAIVFTEDWEDMEDAQLLKRDAATAESCLIDREDEALLQKAIAALPAHYRQTLVLRHVEGLTYCEIAEITGVSIGTVMSRLSRARRHLTERLKQRETVINSKRTRVSKGERKREKGDE